MTIANLQTIAMTLINHAACLPVRCLRTILLQISHEARAAAGLGVAIARVAAVIGTSQKLAVWALEAFGTLAAPPGRFAQKKNMQNAMGSI